MLLNRFFHRCLQLCAVGAAFAGSGRPHMHWDAMSARDELQSRTRQARTTIGSGTLLALALAALVFLVAISGILLTRETGRIATLWPANAVMLSFILRAEPRRWRVLAAAGLGGNLLAHLSG